MPIANAPNLYVKQRKLEKTMNRKQLISCLVTFSASLLITLNSSAQESSICALKGAPASEYKYKTIQKVKVGKNSYGSVTQIQPVFATKAKSVGAEAIIYYNASQRFGFFPWRFVRPVITGTAITWDTTNEKSFPCTESGGFYL